MAKDFSKKFYHSKAWTSCRQDFINKRILIDGGLCQRCRQIPGYIVHHKIELSPLNINDINITLNHCNLEYLCHECHNLEHSAEFTASRGMVCCIDENGRVIPNENR